MATRRPIAVKSEKPTRDMAHVADPKQIVAKAAAVGAPLRRALKTLKK